MNSYGLGEASRVRLSPAELMPPSDGIHGEWAILHQHRPHLGRNGGRLWAICALVAQARERFRTLVRVRCGLGTHTARFRRWYVTTQIRDHDETSDISRKLRWIRLGACGVVGGELQWVCVDSRTEASGKKRGVPKSEMGDAHQFGRSRHHRARILTRVGATGASRYDGAGACGPGRVRLPMSAQLRAL